MEPKRHIGPQDLIYAQPVSLKPVGRPIAAIPIKASGTPLGPVEYGPPRPVPYPYGNGGLPPYPNIGSSYNNIPMKKRTGPYGITNNRPPQVFENEAAESFRPVQSLSGTIPVGSQPAGGLQQHVHHHYHHGDGADGIKGAAATINPGFSPIGGSLYGNQNEGPSSLYGQYNYGGNFDNYEGAANPLQYKKQYNLKPPSSKSRTVLSVLPRNTILSATVKFKSKIIFR